MMDKRTTAKIITTVVCLVLSLIALCAFGFWLEISTGWRVFLILLAISWVASCVMELYGYFRKQ